MKGYIIVSYGDDRSEDYIARHPEYDSPWGRKAVILNKAKAERLCKKLQKEYDMDQHYNLYAFEVEEIEIIE